MNHKVNVPQKHGWAPPLFFALFLFLSIPFSYELCDDPLLCTSSAWRRRRTRTRKKLKNRHEETGRDPLAFNPETLGCLLLLLLLFGRAHITQRDTMYWRALDSAIAQHSRTVNALQIDHHHHQKKESFLKSKVKKGKEKCRTPETVARGMLCLLRGGFTLCGSAKDVNQIKRPLKIKTN